MEYWRTLFPKLTEDDIVSYEQNYVNSKEETDDLVKAYISHKGDMKKIAQVMMFSEHHDALARYYDILQPKIKANELQHFSRFPTKRPVIKKRKAKKAQAPDEDLLRQMIRQRASRDGDTLLDKLEQKYAKKKKPKTESLLFSGIKYPVL